MINCWRSNEQIVTKFAGGGVMKIVGRDFDRISIITYTLANIVAVMLTMDNCRDPAVVAVSGRAAFSYRSIGYTVKVLLNVESQINSGLLKQHRVVRVYQP